MILGIWPPLMAFDNARTRIRTHTDNCGPPPRHPTAHRARRSRRAAQREERNESGRPNRADDHPQPGELRDRTPPPWRTWDARSFAGARTDVSERADQTTATPRPATIDIRRGVRLPPHAKGQTAEPSRSPALPVVPLSRRSDQHQPAAWRQPDVRARRDFALNRSGQAASRRRAFCTDGSALFARASGRARTSTLAGLAAIVISSPLAGLRPWRFFCAGLTRTVTCTSPPIRTFCALPSSSRTTASSASRTRLASALANSARSATAASSCGWVSAMASPSLSRESAIIGRYSNVRIGRAGHSGYRALPRLRRACRDLGSGALGFSGMGFRPRAHLQAPSPTPSARRCCNEPHSGGAGQTPSALPRVRSLVREFPGDAADRKVRGPLIGGRGQLRAEVPRDLRSDDQDGLPASAPVGVSVYHSAPKLLSNWP